MLKSIMKNLCFLFLFLLVAGFPSAHAQNVTVGATSGIMSSTAAFSNGWADGTIGSLQRGSTYYLFGAAGGGGVSPQILTSPDLSNLGSNFSTYSVTTPIPFGGTGSFDQNYTGAGGVHFDSGSGYLITVYHGEFWYGGDYHNFYSGLGLAYSTDIGHTWHRLGQIISPQLARTANCNFDIGQGGLLDGGDGYLYVYYSDTNSCPGGNAAYHIAVARASISSVVAAAMAGVPFTSGAGTLFQKYSGSTFSQAGVNDLANPQNGGGAFTAIVTGPTLDPDVAFDSYAGKYVMIWSASDTSIQLSLSTDKVTWNAPQTIVSASVAYPTLINTAGGDPRTLGSSFNVWYTSPTSGLWGSSNLYSVSLTIAGGGSSAVTPTPSPGAGTYTGTQVVTLSTSSGSVICYNTTGAPATNGTTGCTAGTHYTGSFSVTASETLYFVAGGTGFVDSAVGSAAYTISPSGATIYYIDYSNGADTNTGLSKAAPWKHAPGMNGVSGNANITPNPGDQIILKGCVTWPNVVFSWTLPGTGTSGSHIYYGVDKTWWDSMVSGCASAWNRPIFDLQGATVTDPLQRIFISFNDYVDLDNFEVINVLDADSNFSGENETVIFNPGNNVTFSNMYVHHWKEEFFAVGTGNLASGSHTITNFVPYGYSPMVPSASWIGTGAGQSQNIIVGTIGNCTGGGVPQAGNGAQLTGVSGSGPYSITWGSTGPAAGNGTGCVITVGGDFLIFFGGNEAGNTNAVAQDNVFDGSDSQGALLNPYPDCGATESNNNICVSSGIVAWRGPQIFRNNVIRYVASAAVGACTEWSGNLIEYIRPSTNASAHTNGIECLAEIPSNNVTLLYNNVFRHWNVQNPSEPHYPWSVGLGTAWSAPIGTTTYAFNNVGFDTINNVWFGPSGDGYGCSANCGASVNFNNTGDGGPSWSLTYSPSNSCPSVMSSCTFLNNHWVTGAASQFQGGSCGSNCTVNHDLLQTVATANGQGYSESQTYAYSPTSGGGSTVGAGTNIASICNTISLANAAAGTACGLDTPYAVGYNTTNHTVTIPARTPATRPAIPDIGAYQFSGSAVPSAPTGLTAVLH